MSVVSSIKPETEKNSKKIRSTIEYNDLTWQSYIDEGFEESIPHSVEGPHERLVKFAAQAGERPVTRTVERIYRMKPAANGYKECIVYYETLTGTTWAGEEVILRDHEVGHYKKQIRKPRINEKKEIVEYVRGGERDIYTHEYTKQNLDAIIAGQNKEAIHFIITNPNGPQSSEFLYEEFVLPWNDCINLLLQPGGPMAYHVDKIVKTQQRLENARAP